METQFVEFSLVVLANNHNPTILNPDFLKINQIVKDEWGWKVIGQPITTPAIATVTYGSKVVVTVDPMKLQVTDTSGSNIEQNHLCDIVSEYVDVLSHVEYSALGVNFTMITMVDDTTDYLNRRFLKDGAWDQGNNKLQSVGVKFSYGLEDGGVTFSIDKGHREDAEKPFIVSRANFHRDLGICNMPVSEQIKNILVNIENDWERFQQLHSAIIEK